MPMIGGCADAPDHTHCSTGTGSPLWMRPQTWYPLYLGLPRTGPHHRVGPSALSDPVGTRWHRVACTVKAVHDLVNRLFIVDKPPEDHLYDGGFDSFDQQPGAVARGRRPAGEIRIRCDR